jgi:hypothetical protein
MLGRLKDQARYLSGLVRFLRRTVTLEQARQRLEGQIDRREQSFLDVLERGVYANPESPYLKLLNHAGVSLQDVRQLVGEAGLEGALVQLYEQGVYLTLEEVRGITPVRRDSLEFEVGSTDLDNPLARSYFQGVSSGSRSQGRRVFYDFDRLEHESAYVSQLMAAHGLSHRPMAVWRPPPPDATGLNALFRYTKVGSKIERWFSQSPPGLKSQGRGPAMLLYSTLLVSRLVRRGLPWPEFVPRSEAVTVARWLAEKRAQGTPGCLDTSASGATRVCLAAMEHGLDISDSVFRVGGEPYTAAKAAVLASAGTRALDRYALTEVGIAALGCANPAQIDDMHVTTDKIAVVQRDKVVSAAGDTVPALVYTTILPSCGTIMLNTESGDYGQLSERDCGCPLQRLGLTTHLLGLRSYDKLTSEGVSFLGIELYELVEEVLPGRFGGNPTDYQLVEEEDEGLPRVSIVVAPEVGEVDEEALVATVLAALDKTLGGQTMADQWRAGGTLRVLRREPFASGSRKILPLHVLR